MAGGTVAAQIQVFFVFILIHTQLFDTRRQDRKILFTLAAADDLADPGNQAVHGRHGLPVRVQLHIEGLDLLRIVGDKDGALEDLLR